MSVFEFQIKPISKEIGVSSDLNYIHDSDLTEETFFLYAAKHYDNPACYSLDEFYQDLTIPLHVKKLFTRYHINGVLKDRLILNHIISFYNVFSNQAATKILFYKIEPKYHSYLKTFLVYLNRCPDYVKFNGKILNIKRDIVSDETLLATLVEVSK